MAKEGMIGLEIHTYVLTKEKLFCRCAASRERGLKANSNVCAICTGQPGAKPMMPNKTAVEKAVQIALMLGCSVNEEVFWQRKHYDWPDMPKGYQNTISGSSAISLGVKGKFAGIGIWSMHLEEDPAAWEPSTGCVDYNRSGLPLVEIITAPEFKNAEEVISWLKKLVHSLAYLKAADSNAGIKVDVNVNIPGKTERVEIKNINSLESIGRAIEYELERQEKEGNSKKETRRFDDVKGKTMKMRDKEGADDYRFIIDPDLPEIVLGKSFVDKIRKAMPETPEKKLEKLVKKYKIDEKNASILAKNIDIVEFFEKIADGVDAEFALPWVTIELLRVLNYNKKKLDEVDIKVEHFTALLKMIKEGKITVLQGKQMLNGFYPRSSMPQSSASSGKITDEKEIEKIALKAIEKSPKAVEDYKKGEKNALNFILGEVMKLSQKRADFAVARKVIERLLK